MCIFLCKYCVRTIYIMIHLKLTMIWMTLGLNNTELLKTLTSHVDSQAKCKTRCWAGRIRGNFNDQPDGFRGPKARMGSSTRNFVSGFRLCLVVCIAKFVSSILKFCFHCFPINLSLNWFLKVLVILSFFINVMINDGFFYF